MAPLSLAWSTTFPFSRETACFSLGTLGTSAAGWVHAGVHGGGRGASFEYPAYKFGRLLFWSYGLPGDTGQSPEHLSLGPGSISRDSWHCLPPPPEVLTEY